MTRPAAPAFTPGPWAMYPMLTGGFRVKAYDGRDAWTWIADVSPVIKDDSGDASGEGVANARLIAAAPDLFAACEAIVAWDPAAAPGETNGMSIMDAQDIARAALRRARGEGDQNG